MATASSPNVLVAGGAGAVGEGICRRLLEAGWRVTVTSRRGARLEELRERLDDPGDALVTLVADVGIPDGARDAREQVEAAVGDLDAVVAALGGWWSGDRVIDLDLDRWRSVLDSGLTAHLAVARAFLPGLLDRPGASYTLLNGSGAHTPVPGAGPTCVSAAAQLMLKDVLAAEHADDRVRINTLLLETPIITRTRPDGPADWLTADEVGRYVTYLLSATGSDVRGETIRFGDRGQLDGMPG